MGSVRDKYNTDAMSNQRVVRMPFGVVQSSARHVNFMSTSANVSAEHATLLQLPKQLYSQVLATNWGAYLLTFILSLLLFLAVNYAISETPITQIF
jgi:hypothetical protein